MNSYPVMDSFNETCAFIITLFRNVCFNMSNYQYILYTNDTQKIQEKLKITSMSHFYIIRYRYYYHWRKTWKYCWDTSHPFLELFRSLNYTIVNSQLPSFEFINSKNNWMIMPWTGGNIAHSIEVSNYLIHYFVHMNIYPKVLLLIYHYL